MQVAAGTRFGPFLGKWVLEPQREEHAWEVSEALLSFWQLCLYRGVKTFFKELLLQGKNISQKNTLFIIYHTVPVSNCYCCCYWSHWAAVSRHLATFCGKFWAAVIFWTFSAIFGIFSEVLPMGTVDTLYL